jgi:actin-related protein
MEKVWHHTLFNELRVSPEDYALLMTDAPLNARENKEKMTEIMFEIFSIPQLQIINQSVCALYASGRTTGVVLDSGDGISHTVPIYEGFAVPHAIQRIFIAGRDSTNYLKSLLKERNYTFSASSEDNIIRNIKETMGYVVGDFSHAMREAQDSHACEKNYELPDGSKILIGNERFRCAEILFNPKLAGHDVNGVH